MPFRLSLSGLNSRVARRLFVLLLVAALLPTGLLSFLAYVGVETSLLETDRRRLASDAKNQGMQIVQRLRWVSNLLVEAAPELAMESTTPHRWLRFGRPIGITGFKLLGPTAASVLSDRQKEHLARGKAALLLDNVSQPMVLVAVRDGSRLVAALLDPEIIWGEETQVDGFCVLVPTGQTLFCTPGHSAPSEIGTSILTSTDSAIVQAVSPRATRLWARWHARLDPLFASDGFVVVVSARRADVTGGLAWTWQVFPPVMVLAVALAILLAVAQIRRQVGPLAELEAKTRMLAMGDFSGRIDLRGDDEFASLARSFNRTAESLNLRFHLLRTLADLDRAILDTASDDVLIGILLKGVAAANLSSGARILWTGDEGSTVSRLGPGGMVETNPASPEAEQLFTDLRTKQACFSVSAADDNEDAAGRLMLREEGAALAFVFPRRTQKATDCLLLFLFREKPENSEEVVQAGTSLADRLSVAAANREWHEALFRQAHHDALTQLPNRIMLRDRMEQAILRAQRDNKSIIVMLIDLDDFKHVNDSLGHTAGDALLVSIAARLSSVARASDTIARIGGDEFVLVAPDIPSENTSLSAERLVQSIQMAFFQPFDLGSCQVRASASIGISIFPDNACNAEELLQDADAAMYESKRTDRGSYRFYSNRMNEEVRKRFELAQSIRDAFETREFFLMYQPKVEAHTHRIVGVEALARWQSPERGLVSPADFIPVIDSIGLGNRFGLWVIGRACAQIADWRKRLEWNGSVSINVSPSQIESGEIVRHVRDALDRHDLPPEALEIEVLESMAISDFGNANATLAKLRDLGVSVALDDFGTGYSSLVYLTELQTNVLKIDRAFITNIVSSERQRTITQRIISLASSLGFQVVAEGVENREQERMLAAMGCDLFQGYLFSPPLAAPDLEALIERGILAAAE